MSNTAANKKARVLRVTFSLTLLVTAFLSAISCGSYDPLPPKTEASTSYYIPAAEAPTQAEIDAMKAEREEYNRMTK